jgi:SAM-dependent methyltransferase
MGFLLAEFTAGFANQSPYLRMLLIEWPISLSPALFTWLLPGMLGYSRGGMARVGVCITAFFTLAIPLQLIWPPWQAWYWNVHPWLYGVFYVYALAGSALCWVGIYDGKRSAVWTLLAVLAFTGSAVADTIVWLGLATGPPSVPTGFIAFWMLLGIGALRKRVDRQPPLDRIEASRTLANNLTRRSCSIPRKLLREGNLHLLPLYYSLNLSDLGHEGIESSGSYRFADHIYRNVPSGRGAIGCWLDAKMLASPASEAFRDRYRQARDAMRIALESFPPDASPLHLLAIPCGLPRDLNELAKILQRENPALLARVEYTGMDIDPELLRLAADFTAGCPVPLHFLQGNALLRETFPAGRFHCVVSTGLNEFLEAPQLAQFFGNVNDLLVPGGIFFTSLTRKERSSEFLMKAFELITRYRSIGELEGILEQFSWNRLKIWPHETGLQMFVMAVR